MLVDSGSTYLQNFGKGVLLQVVSLEADIEKEKKLRMRKMEKKQFVECMVAIVGKLVLKGLGIVC